MNKDKEARNFYFTFGQRHTHSLNGKTFDKDCVVKIAARTADEARNKMFLFFGEKWSMQYNNKPNMKYFPRGIFTI